MNILICDTETTTSNKGNPFDKTNRLVSVGLKWLDGVPFDFYLIDGNETVQLVQEYINKSTLLVLFNAKFDLHWLRKIGVDISNVSVWDCQLAEFILNNQSTPYPSLDQAAEKYGFEKKIDVVKLEYWDKGINTDEIPREVLSEYLYRDLALTQQVYEKQLELFKTDKRFPLFRLHCQDLLVLEEMEWNGIYYNTAKALEKAETLEQELSDLRKHILTLVPDAPSTINLNSNDHISAILYGGEIVEEIRIPIGVYKTGAKAGQVRNKVVEKVYTFPRLVEPLKGTETKVKEGEEPKYWLVNETVLRKLKLNKKAKQIVETLDKYSKIEKLCGTYLRGWAKLIDKMNWPKDMIYGTLNQCVVITGRLSSSKPNLQNCDPQTKTFLETRYDN